MSPFHSGMNHWQRQWLSDRLHKKNQDQPQMANYSQPESRKPARPKKLKSKPKPTE
jgi:predicted alpha/beta hydrolase family esterase